MKKLLKYTGYFFAGFIALLVVIVIALNLISDTQYKDWITSATKSATGRDFSIGDFELKLGKTFRIKASSVRLANAEWAEQKDMLQVNYMEAELGLLSLFSGKADIRLVVDKADMQAEKNADGVSNWAMGSGKEEDEEDEVELDDSDEDKELSGLPLDPLIREIRIENLNLTRVMGGGLPARITRLKQLLIETPKEDTTINLVANANGHPVEITGNLGSLEKFLYKSSEAVNLKADIDGNILSINGNWGPLFPKQIMQVDIDLNIPSTSGLAEAVNMEIGEFEDIDITGKLIGSGDKLALTDFSINLDDPKALVSIKGSIANLINMKGIKITTKVNTESLGDLLQHLNVELPVPVPPFVQVSADISGGLKELALSELVLNIKDEGVDIQATAAIGDLLHAKKIVGKLNGTVESFSLLSKYAKMDLPSLGKLQLSGDLASNDKALQLNNLDINLISDNIGFAISGKVEDLLTVSGIDAQVKADVSSFSKQNIIELSALFKQLGTELPVAMLPQSINLSSGIKGNLDTLSLVDIQGEVLDKGVKVGLNGSVGNVLALSEIDVKLLLDSDSVAVFSKYAGSELPDTDPLKIMLSVKEDDAKRPNISIQAETGGAQLDVNSVLDSLAVPEKFVMDLSVKAKSLTALNKLAQRELADMGPLDASGKLQIHKNNISVSNLKLLFDEQSATGNLALRLPASDKSPMVIKGKLNVSYLNLNFLLSESEEEGAESVADVSTVSTVTEPDASPVSTDPSVNSDRLFSSEPFQRLMHQYEIDLSLNVNKIKFGKADMNNVEIAVLLEDGLLSVDPIKGAGGAGNMNGIIRIDGRGETPELKIDLSILQVPTPNLGGKLDFDADITGKGKSVAELMGSLNGRILLVMRDGRIEGALVKKMGSGLLSFSKEKNYTTLECGILRVDIIDGIADFEKNLAAQLTEVTWRGGGVVNLKTEELEVGITPKPRKGIPISLTGSLSGLVYVDGTLKNPKIQLDPKEVAVKYAKYTAHIATGGLTLLVEKVKDKIQANQDICEKILDGTVFDREDKEKAKAKEKAEKEAEKNR